MDFQTSVKTCLTEKYATFSGRASRPEYWWLMLAYLIGAVVISLTGIGLLYIVYILAMIVPVTAAGYRRLQDTGRPGWYIFIPVALAVLNTLVMGPMGPGPMGPGGMGPGAMHPGGMRGFGLVSLLGLVQIVVTILFVYWLVQPSQPETNEYGPPPGR
ncbi:DUF805 domain-containing protein [Roseovarius salis]|uniref:DUF805 domain-containing protein n=1 Tax=Roseovarius salis TaxID=3376063 RepID=UPI0037C739DF